MYGHPRRSRRGSGQVPELAEAIRRIDRAVVEAHSDLLATGENVSAWKVAQAAMLTLQANSWDSLGFPMQQVPSLFRIMVTEGKVISFIHCFVGVQRITSLYDLEMAICESEGVQRFEELELGPLLRHPLVLHYFSVGSGVTEVFKITAEEILSFLSVLIWRRKKKITPDDLLDYIAKRKKINKENLCLRVQSLGMHISRIFSARRTENVSLKKCLDALEVKLENEANAHDNDDEHYDNIVVQSSSEISSQNMNKGENEVSCSDPSAAEEKPRVWLDAENDVCHSSSHGSIRIKDNHLSMKRPNLSGTVSVLHEPPKSMPDGSAVGPDLVIDNCKVEVDKHTSLFIKLWRDTCRDSDVQKVFEQMLDYYHKSKKKKMRKAPQMFLKYPYVGLLNVAVASIKLGMWNAIYEASQAFSQHGVADTIPQKYEGHATIELIGDKQDAVVAAKIVSGSEHGVSVEDILKNVCTYFELIDDFPNNENPPPGKKLIFLRKLCKCESWLIEQFSVKDFNSLGFGDFFMFLSKHVSLLPHTCQKYFLTGDTSQKPSLEATMSQHHLAVFLSQASAGLRENENLSKQRVSELLMMQFPSACFTLVENGPSNNFMDSVIENITNLSSSAVLFSATLLACDSENSHSDSHVTAKDAIEVLLTAPMLIDLNSWSFWDLKFAPSLGPLVRWLLSEVKTKELMCLITNGGKVLRLDHSATLSSFLEAFLEGSSYQTAVKLLSLFALYGGERNIPVSLLKCHAEKAYAFLLKGSTDSELDVGKKYVLGGLKKSICEFDKTIPLASRFTLECLGYLPEEFRSFAANLLLTGFQALVKDAPSAILAECKHKEDYLILHELGSSLGIVEWFNDLNTLSLSLSNKSSEPDGEKDTSKIYSIPKDEELLPFKMDRHTVECKENKAMAIRVGNSGESCGDDHIQHSLELQRENNSTFVIESIRREEFGLDPNISASENNILKKQHARLGRALHCLSQELYSQDSHFLLELVQNADDNVYPGYVEPTLIFILQEGGIVVLNNEQGFSTENIRALCDVGNSTKKGSTAGYIGKKGIGFKSVFRVTDAPEIHSNGFHIKFDLNEGQIGFVLPTIVPPCDVDLFSNLVSIDANQTDRHLWNTCIYLPFRSKLTEAFSIDNITSMFSDLHPSLLLFLHRLECIKFRNMLTNSLTIMRKVIVGDGIVNVSFGKEKLTWFVESRKMQADLARDNVQTTQISIAFALEVSSDGTYTPKLDQQCVFAFLPLRAYGLKFIIQGDFILPSSREEVDGDSPWNQWLLSEFPNLFVSAERSFCSLSGFKKNPGVGISAFMSFVPLVGEVHGFFSSLPRMIISKLCTSNCLLLEGHNDVWVPPCKVLRSWTEQVRTLLPDSLLFELLGLGYLDKDIVLSDSLARALGTEEYGPKILFQIISSLCCKDGGIKSMGLRWLSSWLNALYETSFHNNKQSSMAFEISTDAINNLRKIPFIPLLDGKYGSITEGAIWMNIDALTGAVDNIYGLEAFPNLFAKLRIVTPALFHDSVVGNLSQILHKVGVQRLSTHEVLKAHVLPAISDEKIARGNQDLIMEYLSFVMVHLQSGCPNCSLEREHIISEIYRKALILTNHGYKRLAEVPIHFSIDFGNSINISKLIDGINVKWSVVDTAYLKYPLDKSLSREMLTWRTFLKEVGVSDFVRLVKVEKAVVDMPHVVLNNMIWDREILIQDWESQELVHLLSQVSTSGDRKKCKYLLRVLDTIWDEYFNDKATAHCNIGVEHKVFKSSLVSILNDVQWIASSVDNELHYPGDLFHDCEAVRSLLGDCAPYAAPKVQNEKLAAHIGFKTRVTTSDILSVIDVWRSFETTFKASVSQMSKFCTFIWNEMASSEQELMENLRSRAFIFVPFSSASTSEEVVPGVLLSPQEVYWHDDTGSVEQIEMIPLQGELDVAHEPLCKMLCNIYSGLRDFFVDHCGVSENPLPLDYFQILLRLSTVATPAQAAKKVFQVFLEWADGLKSGILKSKDVEYLKGSLEKKESMVLPTAQDKWVSLHPSFGLVCWCDDDKLINEFESVYSIDFLSLCELSEEEKKMLHTKVSVLMQRLGIPRLSEVVTREAIYYGAADNSFETSLLSWALPYAQRYIHNAYPYIYSQLKESGFANLNHLRIVVVEKLFFRNVIKRCKIASKKRSECNSLLQGDVLYTTPDSGSHSIFMELSSFLLNGISELHLANFLHMITTMAESGSTEEQTELFILNSQKVPKLPQEEQVWSLQPIHDSERTPVTTRVSRMLDEQKNSHSSRKAGSNSNWPPVNWRTAPKLNSDPNTFVSVSTGERNKSEKNNVPGDDGVSIEIDTEWTIGENEGLSFTHALSLKDSKTLENEKDDEIASDGSSSKSLNVTDREELSFGTANAHLAAVTGRRGELLAFKHLKKKHGQKLVKWMNEVKETGLPYDIVLGDEEKGLEYIEVKTTESASKDWFEISASEYQFAVEKGESFSIVHVVLLGKSKARVTTYKNPEKLCRLGRLQLAVLMPKQEKHVLVT